MMPGAAVVLEVQLAVPHRHVLPREPVLQPRDLVVSALDLLVDRPVGLGARGRQDLARRRPARDELVDARIDLEQLEDAHAPAVALVVALLAADRAEQRRALGEPAGDDERHHLGRAPGGNALRRAQDPRLAEEEGEAGDRRAGDVVCDIAFGGNFYALVPVQPEEVDPARLAYVGQSLGALIGSVSVAVGRTFVDATNTDLARNPDALLRIAQATGLNIVMGTGWYREGWRPVDFNGMGVAELAEDMVSEIVKGVGDAKIRAGVIGSVVPHMTAVAAETVERHIGADPLIITASTPLPIRLDVDEPLSVGADRILNTLAAAQLFRRDTIVVDLGTATTFDCITRDGVFVGGVIAPGVRTGAETLVRRTAKLPRVDLDPPAAVIGRRTENSLRSGIFFGAVESIDGIVRRIQQEWQKPNALVVATGGLAPMLAPHCRTVERVEPFITLQGLELAWRHASKRHGKG